MKETFIILSTHTNFQHFVYLHLCDIFLMRRSKSSFEIRKLCKILMLIYCQQNVCLLREMDLWRLENENKLHKSEIVPMMITSRLSLHACERSWAFVDWTSLFGIWAETFSFFEILAFKILLQTFRIFSSSSLFKKTLSTTKSKFLVFKIFHELSASQFNIIKHQFQLSKHCVA